MAQERPPEIIGAAIKVAREKRGMDRSELAAQCCLSSKMILELEEGGMTAFYSFQLKLSSAKRVGSYLGLTASDYLAQVAPVVDQVDPFVEVENIPDNKEGEKLPQVIASKPVMDEGEQLDDLIYQSTNSGTSLPHIGMRSVPVKWFAVSLGSLITVGLLYGLNGKFEIVNQALAFFDRMGGKKVEQQQPPQELAAQESEQEQVEEKRSAQLEAKSEPVLAVVPPLTQCPQVRDDQLIVYKSPNPSKLGDVVNVKTLVKQSVCVTDSQGKQAMVDLEPNTAHAFKGVSPFIVLAQDLDSMEMYYQGWRVRPPSLGLKYMKLVEVTMQ